MRSDQLPRRRSDKAGVSHQALVLCGRGFSVHGSVVDQRTITLQMMPHQRSSVPSNQSRIEQKRANSGSVVSELTLQIQKLACFTQLTDQGSKNSCRSGLWRIGLQPPQTNESR